MLQRILLAIAAFALAPIFATASDPLSIQEALASNPRRPAPPGRASLPVPPRLPNNPEYLARAIYLIPTDRTLDYAAAPDCPGPACPLYTEKLGDASARIRTALETVSEFYVSEMETYGAANPGRPVNFERDASGAIRVMAINGTMPTAGAGGYWQDATGLNGINVFLPSIYDIFDDSDTLVAASAKTIWTIFPDVMEFDSSTSPSTIRGYCGAGTQLNQSSMGWGGVAVISAGILELFPPDPGDAAGRRLALEDYLCSDTLTQTIGGQTGVWFGPPPTSFAARQLKLGELTSVYMGVIAHEFIHTIGVVHGGLAGFGELMGGGYVRFGAATRAIHGFAPCPAVELEQDPIFPKATLGLAFSGHAARSPYFNAATDPDKSDPDFNFAWPPRGTFTISPAGTPATFFPFKLAGGDAAGSGLALGYLYASDSYLQDYDLFPASGVLGALELPVPWFDPPIGRRTPSFLANDNAGNMRIHAFPMYGAVLEPPYDGGIFRRTVFVRPAAAPRDDAFTTGSHLNAYSAVQEGIDAVAAMGSGTVVLMNGTYSVSAPLILPNNINLVGESVGGVLIDGGGAPIDLLADSAPGNRFGNGLSGIAFANARSAYTQPLADAVYRFHVANCVFFNLSSVAISISQALYEDVEIVQNTVADCGRGFLLSGAGSPSCKRFLLQNNLVAYCSGAGIRLDSIVPPLYGAGRSGWNLSFGNGTNFAGNGDGATGYAANRLPGEFSAAPQFESGPPFAAPTDLRLAPGSRGTHEADPWTENADGQRRDVGAFIDAPDPPSAANEWPEYD